jgi:hypothetical protein
MYLLTSMQGRRFGAGRLDAWEKAIRYINIGITGLRDLKHFKPLEQLKSMSQHFEGRMNVVAMTFMGDFLLSWVLSVGKWFIDHEEEFLSESQFFDALRLLLLNGYTIFFDAFTKQPFAKVFEFMKATIDFDLMATQMMYFMSSIYKFDMEQDLLSGNIYHDVLVRVRKPRDETWSPTLGWSLDGQHQDLGPHNGPFPITELIRSLYITTVMAINLQAVGQAESSIN